MLTKGNWKNLNELSISIICKYSDNNFIQFGGYEALSINNWPKFRYSKKIAYGCRCCGDFH